MTDLLVDDGPITQRLHPLPEATEIDYVSAQHELAREQMLRDPSKDRIVAFELANQKLWDTQELYRIGTKLLIEFNLLRKRILR